MTAGELVEAVDRWVVSLSGCTVIQCRIDHAFTLVISGARGAFELRIEEPFVLRRMVDGGQPLSVRLDGDRTDLAPALALLHADVEDAVAFKDGRLELGFTDGGILRVPSSDQFEAWSLVGPGDLRLVALVGGEVAVWSPESSS